MKIKETSQEGKDEKYRINLDDVTLISFVIISYR